MNKLLIEEYHHFGTNKIQQELWLSVQMEQIYTNYIKPYGGLWTSHQNNYSISDWISYKLENSNPDALDAMQYINSCLVKFKEDSKLLCVETENDYKNLKDSGFINILEKTIILNAWYTKSVNEIIDYEKICNYYDLLYINPNSNNGLQNFSINTMYALNQNCIEHYKPINIDLDNKKIIKIGNKTQIQEPNKEYYELVDLVRNLFQKNINYIDYNDYVKKLYELAKNIEKQLLINIDNINYPNIDKKRLINTIVRNIYRENYLSKQKKLLKK